MINTDQSDKLPTEVLVVDDLPSDERIIWLWSQDQPNFVRVVISNLLTRLQTARGKK